MKRAADAKWYFQHQLTDSTCSERSGRKEEESAF